MGHCMVVWGVACRKWHAGAGDALLLCRQCSPTPRDPAALDQKNTGDGFYEKLALRKTNLLQGDLPPERTAKETGTILKRITPGGKG